MDAADLLPDFLVAIPGRLSAGAQAVGLHFSRPLAVLLSGYYKSITESEMVWPLVTCEKDPAVGRFRDWSVVSVARLDTMSLYCIRTAIRQTLDCRTARIDPSTGDVG